MEGEYLAEIKSRKGMWRWKEETNDVSDSSFTPSVSQSILLSPHPLPVTPLTTSPIPNHRLSVLYKKRTQYLEASPTTLFRCNASHTR